MIRFELFVGKNGQFYFRLVGANNKVMLASEGYTKRSSARRAIRRLKATVAFAPVADAKIVTVK